MYTSQRILLQDALTITVTFVFVSVFFIRDKLHSTVQKYRCCAIVFYFNITGTMNIVSALGIVNNLSKKKHGKYLPTNKTIQ